MRGDLIDAEREIALKNQKIYTLEMGLLKSDKSFSTNYNNNGSNQVSQISKMGRTNNFVYQQTDIN